MGFEALQDIVADCAVQNPMEMIDGPEKERQTKNIHFADKADEGSLCSAAAKRLGGLEVGHNSNLVGSMTGRSAALSPLRIFPA